MLSAILFLVLTLVVFVGATVVAMMVMIRVGAKRGTRSTTVDTAMVSLIQNRKRRLSRRLGLDPEPPAPVDEEEPASTPSASAVE